MASCNSEQTQMMMMMMMERTTKADPPKYPVNLNVYTFNYWYLRCLRLYYSTVQVHGKEYGFSSHGVFRYCAPEHCDGEITLLESIKIGYTTMRSRQVDALFTSELASEYNSEGFHSFLNNGNHFSDRLCLDLTGKRSMPSWVNRAFNFFKRWLGKIPCVLETMDSILRCKIFGYIGERANNNN